MLLLDGVVVFVMLEDECFVEEVAVVDDLLEEEVVLGVELRVDDVLGVL